MKEHIYIPITPEQLLTVNLMLQVSKLSKRDAIFVMQQLALVNYYNIGYRYM